MTTPGRPRQSGIPGPGRASSIPTPGRSRSNSNIHQNYNQTNVDDITRAFADAIKANDPSMHRNTSLAHSTSATSLSPQSGTFSGRRSVAGRPSSAASSSSSKIQDRVKTPLSARVSSRPPSRSEVNKPPKAFEVGDNVRIESLGFEGKLRYVGDIEGKLGLWAGVELSGGFSGKGKNNGSVGGKQYFNCPEKCGVFVATTKLSAPTVGPGVTQRPPSVASSRGPKTSLSSGRVTPSFSGTRTPSASFSNGRVTPSIGGRITPSDSSGRITPSSALSGLSQQRLFKTPTSKPKGLPLSDKITAGSRASKYMTMTAQQLNLRDKPSPDISTRKPDSSSISLNSPTMSRTLSSPSRSSGSPFSTPRAGSLRPTNSSGSPTLTSTRSHPSMNTPRMRVPSGVAMPPPPFPQPLQSHQLQVGVEQSSSPPQSRGDNLIQEQHASSVPSISSTSRPSSSTSFRSVGTDELGVIEQLQSRLEAAEYENVRLRMASEAAVASSAETEQLRVENVEIIGKLKVVEEKVSTLRDLVSSQEMDVETLRDENERLRQELADNAEQAQQDISTRRAESESLALEMKSLLEKLDEFEALILHKDEVNATQASSIQKLSAELEKLQADFQEECKELYIQIDELRIAGQETIALYEERLSAANSQRYEFEHTISTLEANLKAALANNGPHEPTSTVSAAKQIDNETLQEQVQYLQNKSAKLEEQLEDTRAALEKDMISYQDKVSRIRMEEEQHKRDLNLKEREYEQLMKSEARARNRVEEIEEALRESTVALESTRGEVEALRAEMANLDVLIDDATEGDISSKLTNFTKRMAADKAKYKQELSLLEQALSDSQAEKDSLVAQMSAHPTKPTDSDLLTNTNDSLRQQVVKLEARVLALDQELETRTAELEVLRKKHNREATMTNGTPETSSGKPEPSSEEVAGLKHIVQELQKENLASAQQIKLLESENELLATEAEQLRQEVQLLEDNLDKSLVEEGQENNGTKAPRPLSDQRIRFESDLDQVRKRLSEAEIKHARTIHSLNKEISELEALVESKIYREDELEQEIEKLKDKLARQKKTSKNTGDTTEGRQRLSTASSTSGGTGIIGGSREQEVCEICERPGHDIFNCSLLKEDKGVVCEDCESPGHVAADCPHSLDVF